MPFENLTRCPRCKRPLALLPLIPTKAGRWVKLRNAYDEFDFHCEPCNQDYTLKDNTLLDKTPEMAQKVEDEAGDHLETENAFDNRCPDCRRATMWKLGTGLLTCLWCNRDYVLTNGVLQAKGPEQNRSGRSLSAFHAFDE